MTSEEWLQCKDPQAMLDMMRHQARMPSDRKLRLFACAVSRLLHGPHPERDAVHTACEQIADGKESQWGKEVKGLEGARKSIDAVWGWTWCCTAEKIVHALTDTLIQYRGNAGSFYRQKEVASLLREIVGNPLSPLRIRRENGSMEVDEPWYTPLVKTMAEAIYQDRAWEDLPILADAMEEAGCSGYPCPKCHGSGTYTVQATNAGLSRANGYGAATTYSEWRGCRHCGGDYDRKGTGRIPHPLLVHLRDPGPHVLGCWALDLLT